MHEMTFKLHIYHKHYMWDYLFFISCIHEKRITEYSGEESYVYKKFKNNSLSWIPYKKCLNLDPESDGEEAIQTKLLENIHSQMCKITNSYTSINNKLRDHIATKKQENKLKQGLTGLGQLVNVRTTSVGAVNGAPEAGGLPLLGLIK